LGAEMELTDGEECACEEFLYGFGLVVDLLEVELDVLVVTEILKENLVNNWLDHFISCACLPPDIPSIPQEEFPNQRSL
jgi:hypothetical protein